MTSRWQASASLTTLKKRARLLTELRAFFLERDLVEVDVPVLGRFTVSDPQLRPLTAKVNGQTEFLQTSPEFYMKRLLAQGLGSCFYLGKAFRGDERGRRHRPEFTLLEWYRIDYDDLQLGDEVIQLLERVAAQFGLTDLATRHIRYGELFHQHLGLDPHAASAEALAAVAAEKLDVQWPDTDKGTWLDLLFSHCIEPHLEGLVMVSDYPACQCALARLASNSVGHTVAKRFEVFWDGMELANGYWELSDAKEQATRFEADNHQRREMGLPAVTPDPYLLSALEEGLPGCAGVALGVDRLLMCLTEASSIDEVVPF